MMGRLYSVGSVVALAVLLAGGGFVGYLFATGKLNGTRLERMAAVIRGEFDELTPPPPPASQPVAPVEPAPARSAEEVRKAREAEQLRRATLERAAIDAQARQRLVDQALAHLVSEQEKFAADRQAWEQQQKKLSDQSRDEGFKRELAYVSKLTPKLAKEHVVRTWKKHKADAVRLFMALEPGKGQKILEELKAPEELEIMHELLEQIRLQDVDSFVSGSRKAADDASP